MTTSRIDFGLLIQSGNAQGVRCALHVQPELANETIHWVRNQKNESDPPHYVSDSLFHGWLNNGAEGEIAEVLLAHGAAIEGSENRESTVISAASLGAQTVATFLLNAGAALERTSVFGERALHWAAWMGSSATVELLLSRGSQVEPRGSEFGATPLFWAAHGYGPNGPKQKQDQLGAAKWLIRAGARVDTANKAGLSAVELAKRGARQDLYQLLTGSQVR